jgi:N-methylhydantoinase B/oxoprolinase/acetone carboxylase alpha subunit
VALKIDPVTVQILRNRIGCLMEEMSHHFFRSGYSTIIRESRISPASSWMRKDG